MQWGRLESIGVEWGRLGWDIWGLTWVFGRGFYGDTGEVGEGVSEHEVKMEMSASVRYIIA